MDGKAFLSIRVSEALRNRVKAVAAERGEKLQDLIGCLIERFLEDAERKPPHLADVLGRLRGHQALLRGKGITALFVFGSVARGDARPDSDVDIAVEFADDAKPSLFEIVGLKTDLEGILERPVDVGERSGMTERVAASAEGDLVRVF